MALHAARYIEGRMYIVKLRLTRCCKMQSCISIERKRDTEKEREKNILSSFCYSVILDRRYRKIVYSYIRIT